MNFEVKNRWMQALRSGAYKQNEGLLHQNDCFCALGVLCDLVKDQVNGRWEASGNDFSYFVVPNEMHCMSCPPLLVKDFAGIGFNDENEIVQLNDNGHSFREIADWIEDNL